MSGQKRKAPTNTPRLSPRPPRLIRKTGAYVAREQHLLDAQEATDLGSSKCSGILTGDGVIVSNPLDIAALMKVGSYGKGIFSRSVPCHGQLPLFKFPHRSDTVAERSPSSEDHSSRELSGPEMELLQKMSQYMETQKKRIHLHEEWKKEAEQIDESNILSSEQQNYESRVPELVMKKTTAMETESNLQLQAARPDTALMTSPNSTSPQQISTLMETDSREERGSTEMSGLVPAGPSLEEHYKLFKEKIDLLDKADSYKMFEYLQLGSEEAFYLSHKLNILNIISEDGGKNLNETELWECFRNKNFIPRYVAYCYYRERGWVPKSGLKFGVDFVLYKHGPVTHHSSYAVVVRMINGRNKSDEETTQEETSTVSTDHNVKACQTGLTWRDVIAFDRVSKSVVKDLIVCYVVNHHQLPWNETVKEFPSCLEKLSISEIFVKRWEPDKERLKFD